MRTKTAKQVIRAIEARGGVLIRQNGSHRRYRVTVGDVTVHTTVPAHSSKAIPQGTLQGIQRDLAPALGKGWLE